jgi:hypothetical protein
MTISSKLKPLRVVLATVLIAAAAGVQAQDPKPAAAENVLSIAEIESRLTAQGIKVEEIEVRDLVAEVEGRDSTGREIDLVVDRRTGEILSRKFDD